MSSTKRSRRPRGLHHKRKWCTCGGHSASDAKKCTHHRSTATRLAHRKEKLTGIGLVNGKVTHFRPSDALAEQELLDSESR